MSGLVWTRHPNAESSRALNSNRCPIQIFLGLKTKPSIEISNPVYSLGHLRIAEHQQENVQFSPDWTSKCRLRQSPKCQDIFGTENQTLLLRFQILFIVKEEAWTPTHSRAPARKSMNDHFCTHHSTMCPKLYIPSTRITDLIIQNFSKNN